MKLFWKIAIGIVAWSLMTAYLVWAIGVTRKGIDGVPIVDVDVAVWDSSRQNVVTGVELREWIGQTGVDLRNSDINELNTELIRKAIASKPFVANVVTYSTLEGKVVVRASQRYPICRVTTNNGYDFYLTEDGYVLPAQPDISLYLPIITGAFTPPFEQGYTGIVTPNEKKVGENYIFLSKLINFVKFIENDQFWSNQIVQINILEQSPAEMLCDWKEPNIELVPRAGDFTILFGELNDVPQKFEKLMLMYDNVIGFEGWQDFKVINLRYGNQVVCSN